MNELLEYDFKSNGDVFGIGTECDVELFKWSKAELIQRPALCPRILCESSAGNELTEPMNTHFLGR